MQEESKIEEFDESEFDVPDDDVDLEALNEIQKRMIKDKTVLSKKAPELNDLNMRDAYIKQQVSNKQLVERKAEQKRVIQKHVQNIKKDVRQELVFKFVKQQYLS